MATKKQKIYTAKISESNRRWLSIILVVAFIALLFQLDVVAKPVLKVLSKIWTKVKFELKQFQKVSSHIFGLTFGGAGLFVGVLLLPTVPFVGLGLVVGGGIVLALKLWQIKNVLSKEDPQAIPTGDIESLGSIGGVGPVSGQPRNNQPYGM